MRWSLALLFTLSVLHVACGRSELDMPAVQDVPCQTEATCPPGLTCVYGLCVLPGDDPSAGTGGGGGSQTPDSSAGGGWGGTQEPAVGGAAGITSSPESSTGGRGPVPAGRSAGAGAIAGRPGTGGVVAGNPASRSSSVAGQPSTGGRSVGGQISVIRAGTTSIPGGSGGTSRTSSSSSRMNGEITFNSGQAVGRLMTGYAWVAMGNSDSMTSPTCDTGQPITNAMPCTTETMWSTRNSLCMSGSIPALPAAPVQADYDDNWGMEIGVNAKQPPDAVGTAMAPFTTVTFSFSGIPRSGVRAFIHRKGDPDWTTYCVDSIKSEAAISLTKFNTKCWGDPSTVFLTLADLPSIDKIGLMVSSSASAISVNNFCLERIIFFN